MVIYLNERGILPFPSLALGILTGSTVGTNCLEGNNNIEISRGREGMFFFFFFNSKIECG